MSTPISPRKSPSTPKISRSEFEKRFRQVFQDPVFSPYQEPLRRMAAEAWQLHQDGKKSARTAPAGNGFAHPSFEISDEWRATKRAIAAAERQQKNSRSPRRVLLISAAHRNQNTCPGEVSKTRRLAEIARHALERAKMEVDFLDLSHVTSEFGRNIYPCKACVSTAMPLCHWPCSCYPNQALGQELDWMNEIYPLWAGAHGVMILTPVYWHQAPSALKSMMDRLVCADGGNPDLTSTKGKDAKIAKRMEENWGYPRHLAGRIFSLVVHGDVAGTDVLKNALHSWLTDMGLLPATATSQLARYLGYMKDYAHSHDDLDADRALQAEVRLAARGLARAIREQKRGSLHSLELKEEGPRPK